MKNIDVNKISEVINESHTGFWQNLPLSEELVKHENYLKSRSIIKCTLTADDVYRNYELGSKEMNKLKRVDPNKPIVDAYDIDWSGYSITFDGHIYTPKSTYEMLDLIFRILNRLHNYHDDEDVIWNDYGESRTDNHVVNWSLEGKGVIPVEKESEYTTKLWNYDGDVNYVTSDIGSDDYFTDED